MAMKPVVNQEKVNVKVNGSFQKICPFPVGYIYTSFEPTPPGEIFGGNWTEITGKFLYCNKNTRTGGAAAVKIEEQHLPHHTHAISNRTIVISKNNFGNLGCSAGKGFSTAGFLRDNKHETELDRVGNEDEVLPNKGFSIMPPYQSCYAWRRSKDS